MVLGIDPKADSAAIQRAYSKLAQKYYPNNSETADSAMFDAVNMAYETLSDPSLRAIFDKLKGIGSEDGQPKFSGPEFFNALGDGTVLRSAILCVLYDRRRIKPTTPSLSMRHLELIVEASEVQLTSALWYLKQRGMVVSDDKSSLQITVDGMDHLETNRPLAEDVMAFIKPTGIAAQNNQPVTKQPVATEEESVLSTLNRALART